jgi:hypothetical protein
VIPDPSGAKYFMYSIPRSLGYIPSEPRHCITSTSGVKDMMYPSEAKDTMYHSGAKVIVCPEPVISWILRSKAYHVSLRSQGYHVYHGAEEHVSPRAKDSVYPSGAKDILYYPEPRISCISQCISAEPMISCILRGK